MIWSRIKSHEQKNKVRENTTFSVLFTYLAVVSLAGELFRRGVERRTYTLGMLALFHVNKLAGFVVGSDSVARRSTEQEHAPHAERASRGRCRDGNRRTETARLRRLTLMAKTCLRRGRLRLVIAATRRLRMSLFFADADAVKAGQAEVADFHLHALFQQEYVARL